MPFARTPSNKIQAGKLRQRITIQARDAGKDSFGAPLTTFSNVATIWARVVSVSGTEEFRGQALNPIVTHVVTVRDYSVTEALQPTNSLLVGSRNLDIVTINFGERKLDEITIHCVERIGRGPN